MNVQETLDTLKSLGTEQNRKIFRRHGAGEDVYGVSFAALKDLKKKIKTDHELAVALWNTGNHDARMLAAMIADPQRLDARTLDAWAAGLRNYVEMDALGGLAAKAPHARETMTRWIASDGEWIGAAGWKVLAHVAMDGDGPPDEYFERYLSTIESDIRDSPNRIRHQMNGALIAIGLRSPELEEKALAAAARIGKVEVDHGETGCKTPDAAGYIKKVKERKKR
jgi:3-methyladenine DNA glycosylase AlkD